MAPRPYWTGALRMSLVVIPVQIFNAVSSDSSVSFHQIHKPTGKRVRYQRVVPGEGEIESADIAKGYEVAKDQYVLVEPDELKELKLESTKTFNIVQFVDAEEIESVYYDQPYYVMPDGLAGQEAFSVIRDALEASGKVGIGQIVVSGRERLGAIKPHGKGMVLEILRYADEIKNADEFFDTIGRITADEDQIALAQQLIERKSGPFDPTKFEDRYETAVRELIQEKMKGNIISAQEPEPRSAPVIDFMEALKKSLGKSDEDGGSKRGKSRATADEAKPVKKKEASLKQEPPSKAASRQKTAPVRSETPKNKAKAARPAEARATRKRA